ncbi:MAG: hypothetical protein JWR52_33 [Marmoricola sp.]|nr:hypothetical protein [Marmoricola sp.]
MRPSIRILIALLAIALPGAAAFSAPALAVPARSATTATPSPHTTVTSAPTTPGQSAKNDKKLTFAIGPAVQVPKDHYFDGRPYISSQTQAGGVVRDAVALVNVSRTPVTVLVYPADASQNGSTTFQLTTKNQKLTAAGSWLTLKGRKLLRVTIPASHAGANNSNVPGRVLVPFNARVPSTATPGDHAAAIVAELDAPAKNRQGANITLVQRLGVAVYIHLAGELRSGLRVSHLSARWKEPGNAWGKSQFAVTFTVTNTGNVRLNASTLINTTRWFLGPVRSYPGELSNLFPGSSVTVSVTVPKAFGFGSWHTVASAFGTPVDPAVVLTTAPASQSVGLWPVPWILIAIVVGLILLTYEAQRRYRRWRRHRKEHPPVKGQRSSKQRVLATSKAGRA